MTITNILFNVQCINVLFQGLYECVSLCFHPFGVVLAAGSTEGHLVVLNAENGAPVVTIRVCGSPLNCLGYNPGNLLFSSYHYIGPSFKQRHYFIWQLSTFTCFHLALRV